MTDHDTRVEGDRLAVGAFTAIATFDDPSARIVLDDASADELREAVLTLAQVLAGTIIGHAIERGRDPEIAVRSAAINFGFLTRALRGRHG